jgi:hypothetical protein
LADPRGKSAGWCFDTKQEIAEFIGISRPGLYKMMDRMEQIRLLEIDPPTGFARVTGKWIDSITECKQSLQCDVNFVYTKRKQSLQPSVNKVTLNKEKDIKREKGDYQQEGKAAAGLKIEIHDNELPGSKVLDFMPSEPKENPAPFPPPPAPPAESSPISWQRFDIDSGAAEMLADYLCAEKFCRDSGRKKEEFEGAVGSFVEDQKAIGQKYPNRIEFRRHFFNLVRRKREIESTPKQNQNQPTRNQNTPARSNIQHLGGQDDAKYFQ